MPATSGVLFEETVPGMKEVWRLESRTWLLNIPATWWKDDPLSSTRTTKRITFPFRQKTDKFSPRQFPYLDYISQFPNDIHRISGKKTA